MERTTSASARGFCAECLTRNPSLSDCSGAAVPGRPDCRWMVEACAALGSIQAATHPRPPNSTASSFSAACCCIVGKTWLYVSSVSVTLAGPRRSLTIFGCSPWARSSVAHVCEPAPAEGGAAARHPGAARAPQPGVHAVAVHALAADRPPRLRESARRRCARLHPSCTRNGSGHLRGDARFEEDHEFCGEFERALGDSNFRPLES